MLDTEPTPAAYTCVMGGPASIKDEMNALMVAFNWATGDNFSMQASPDGSAPASWAYGYNDGVTCAWRDLIEGRVFDAPDGMSEAEVNAILNQMHFLFRPVMPGQYGRDVRGGQVEEYLAGLNVLPVVQAGEI